MIWLTFALVLMNGLVRVAVLLPVHRQSNLISDNAAIVLRRTYSRTTTSWDNKKSQYLSLRGNSFLGNKTKIKTRYRKLKVRYSSVEHCLY